MERNGSILAQLTVPEQAWLEGRNLASTMKENKKRSSESSIMQHTCQRSDIHCRGLVTQVMRYLLFSEGGVLSAHALTLVVYLTGNPRHFSKRSPAMNPRGGATREGL
ncbi:uncharacterized protein LOC111132950 isoform X2 [Crassostrea virginica]